MGLGAPGRPPFFWSLQGRAFCCTDSAAGAKGAGIGCDGGKRSAEHGPPLLKARSFGAETAVQEYYDGGGERFAENRRKVTTEHTEITETIQRRGVETRRTEKDRLLKQITCWQPINPLTAGMGLAYNL